MSYRDDDGMGRRPLALPRGKPRREGGAPALPAMLLLTYRFATPFSLRLLIFSLLLRRRSGGLSLWA